MKYLPYKSLQTDHFKLLLKSAQILALIAIIGFYITLFVAAIAYFGFEPEQQAATQTAKTLTNAILIGGISTCFFAYAISAMLAGIIALSNKTSLEKPIDLASKRRSSALPLRRSANWVGLTS